MSSYANYWCYVKENIDYSKYGFKHEHNEWVLWMGTRRMTITSKYQLQFNQVIADVLRIFAEMVKDNVIYFETKEEVKKHTIKLTDDELKLIQEMRNKKK